MQVPEKLALIGGSILLSSTLIFTLKSQASSIIPHVGHSISNVYQDITNTNAEHGGMSFDDALKNAQQQGWTTGQWGTSKYYIDHDMNMHIGAGRLQGKLYDVVGKQIAHSIHTINLDEDAQAPQDSGDLFTGRDYYGDPNKDSNHSIVAINGLEHLDTSHTDYMGDMFYHDNALSNDLNISNWDTSHVYGMPGMFGQTNLSHLNIANWDVRKANNMSWFATGDSRLDGLNLSGWHTDSLQDARSMFSTNDGSLQSLDLSNFDTTNANTDHFLGGVADWDVSPRNLNKITLGDRTQLHTSVGISGNWSNGSQTLHIDQLIDGNSHPGTWVKQ